MTLIVIKPRQSGKTHDLIVKAAEDNLYIICANHQSVQNVADMAKKMGVKIAYPLTMAEFIERRYHGNGMKGFLVDDIDRCLNQISTIPVYGFSATGECA